MKMFNYLNQQQISDMMLLFCVGDKIEKIIDTWVRYENMTKEEAKYIRTSRTYYNKFFDSVQERLPDKEKDKLIAKDAELKKLDKANKDLYKANKVLIEGFNSANRSNWCNEESKRQLIKLAEDMLEADKINKNEIASYLLEITKYMGGGEPIDIHVNENFEM